MLIGSPPRDYKHKTINMWKFKSREKLSKQVEETKSLGGYIDNNLSWKKHVDETSKKVS